MYISPKNADVALVLMLLIPCLFPEAGASTEIPIFAMCDANTTCSIGQYCLDGYCESCVPCEKIQNRQSPSPIDGISCAKKEAECGSCLPGYEEPNLTDVSQMRKCSLIPTVPTPSTSYDYMLWTTVFPTLLVLSILFNLKKQLKQLYRWIAKKLNCKNSDRDNINPDSGNLPPNGHSVSIPNGHSVSNGAELNSYGNHIV